MVDHPPNSPTPTAEPDGGEPTPPPGPRPEEERDSPLRAFMGLFVVPLLVVVVCVGVFVGFGWIAYDRNTVLDYLDDLQSGWRPRRAQAAYELSKILMADPEALADDPAARAEIRRQFELADDDVMRRYLALVLGRTRDPEAVPLLLEAVDDADPETRIYLLMALGASGDRRAVPALVAALGSNDAGLRKTAAYALGEIGDPGAALRVEPLLADPVADVRWNAALALARLGSDAGVQVLERMLDRELTSQVAGITPAQQEEAMVSAVHALAAVSGARHRALFDRLAEEDPSLKVRQAALEAKRSAGGP